MITMIKKLLTEEKGQALPLALIVLAMGSLLVNGFLTSAGTSLLTSRVYSRPLPNNYAADAGIEDAIWNLKYGTFTTTLASPGDQLTYTLPEPVNGTAAEITVIMNQSVVASHDFDDNKFTGGSGWLYGWYHQGSVTMTKKQDPYQGTRHIQMRGTTSYLDRAADLSEYSNLRLQFWAKARSLEGDDKMYCLVSPDDIQWTVVRVWDSSDSDNTYHYYDIDLSPFTMSEVYWIAFDSEMSANNDYFYIDQLRIVGPVTWEIISTAGDRTIKATVEIIEGNVSILSWEIE